MECPLCDDKMVKGFFETHDRSGWCSVWICACEYDDFLKHKIDYDDTVLFISGPLPVDGVAIEND